MYTLQYRQGTRFNHQHSQLIAESVEKFIAYTVQFRFYVWQFDMEIVL